MTVNDLGPFDYIVAGIVLIFFIRGLWVGCIRQIAATLALVGSYWFAGEHIDWVRPYVQDFLDRPAAVFLFSFVVFFLAVSLLLGVLGILLQKIVQLRTAGLLDRFLGGFLGIARGTILVVLGYMLTVFVLSPKHPVLDNALSVPYLHDTSELFLLLIGDTSVRDDLRSALTAPPQQEEQKYPEDIPVQRRAMQQQEQEEEYPQQDEALPQQEILPEATLYYQPYQSSEIFSEASEQQQEYPEDIPVQRREGWED
jgi:membrane protein required for colicin V production